jgi:type VI protein secretion system component Hcp
MLAYVEFSGPVDDYCEATSYSFGVNSSGLAGGTGRTAQGAGVQFTKQHDSLSHALLQHLVAGTVFGTVWVELYRDADSDVYITYTLRDVVISSLNSRGDRESVSLNYRTSKADYFGR